MTDYLGLTMNDIKEPEIIRFLRASGLSLTSEQVEDVIQFQRRADEAKDLSDRLRPAYPIKRDVAALKARWEAHDPNVSRTDDGEGNTTYELHFTEEQRAHIEKSYLASRPPVPNYASGWSHEATIFARIVESWADSIALFQAIAPKSQKTRTRALDSVANAFSKLDQSLAQLDSGALGYWYAKVTDALESNDLDSYEPEPQRASMQSQPMRAVVEAGELRQSLRKAIAAIVEATKNAKSDLPKFDHPENDVRLTTALQLERLIIEHQIPFETKESGFAAIVLRMMFDLAGIEVEKVGYWLNRASEDDRSYARWLQRLRDRQGD